jgi:hypothetical protein
LDPGAPALAPLGISPETLRDWKAGYSNSGTNRGRLAIALHDRDGNTVGFAGRALGEEQPALIIPNGINPQEIIFGAERVEQGTLYLVRDVHDNQDDDLSYRTFINGVLSGNILIDTSQAATDTIDYVATDTWGNTSTSTRTVLIEASPSIVPTNGASTASSSPSAHASTASTTASTTP